MNLNIAQCSRMYRLPPYVFAQVNALKMERRRAGDDIIDLGMGNPDLPAPKHIIDKLVEAARKSHNHRYSASRGITKLREAISSWYKRRYDVDIDPESEAVVTIGAKEGLSHLVLVLISPGDVVFAPNPTYPIHPYSAIIAGGDLMYAADSWSGDNLVYGPTFVMTGLLYLAVCLPVSMLARVLERRSLKHV